MRRRNRMKTNETIEEKQIDEEMPAAPDAATEAPLNDAPDDAERRSAELEAMLAASGSLRPAVPEGFRCGYVAVVGRPNVGKSTLINHLIGEKVSITSKKPQTTRNRVLGVVTKPMAQFVFVDTPGFQTKVKTQLTRRMNRVRAIWKCFRFCLRMQRMSFLRSTRRIFRRIATQCCRSWPNP